MVIKREMSLDSVVFEEFSGGGRRRGGRGGRGRKVPIISVFFRGRGETTGRKQVCVPQPAIALLRVYVIHELDLHAPVLVCACVSVCVCECVRRPVQE